MEWLEENPRRPPKKWMRHCVAGASRSSRDPGAVCGALWYHKMSASQRRAALAREGKLEENAPGNLLVPLLIGGAVLAGVLWWAKKSKPQETSTGTLPAPPAPVSSLCEVQPNTLLQWGQSLGIAALYAPGVQFSCVDMPGQASSSCPTAAEAKAALSADLQSQLDNLPAASSVVIATKRKGYWEFWYWAKDTDRGALRQDLYESYCQNFGTLQGHPANFFLF